MIIDLPRFQANEAYKYLLYSWIRCFRMNFPDVTIEGAIGNFMKHHKSYGEILGVENFNADSARVTYYYLDKQFMEMYKDSK